MQQKIKTSEKVKKTGYVCLMSFLGGEGGKEGGFSKSKNAPNDKPVG